MPKITTAVAVDGRGFDVDFDFYYYPATNLNPEEKDITLDEIRWDEPGNSEPLTEEEYHEWEDRIESAVWEKIHDGGFHDI